MVQAMLVDWRFLELVGAFCFNWSQMLYTKRESSVLIVSLDVSAIYLVAFGAALIVFGPISWIWFGRKA